MTYFGVGIYINVNVMSISPNVLADFKSILWVSLVGVSTESPFTLIELST